MEQITEEQVIKRLSNSELIWAWKWEDELRTEMRFYDEHPIDDVIRKDKNFKSNRECRIYTCSLIDALTFFSHEDVVYSIEKRMIMDGFDSSLYDIEVDKKAFEEFVKTHITLNKKLQIIGFESFCLKRIT